MRGKARNVSHMRTLREILDGNTVTPEVRAARRAEARQELMRATVTNPGYMEHLQKKHGKRRGWLLAALQEFDPNS